MDDLYDVIIVGGGPAGLTGAIYTARAFLKTLVIAGSNPGGQLMATTDVDNFPGFPEGILGPDLIAKMRKQAERFDAEFVNEDVVEISGDTSSGFKVKAMSGVEYNAKTVIVATGASAKWLGLESEQKLRGRGVSACATCDGPFFKNKVVAVIGGGDAAMEESTFLTKYAPKVYVLVRGSKENLRASKIMQNKAFGNDRIEFLFDTKVKEVLGDTKVSGLSIINSQTQKVSELSDVEGLFVTIGHKPNTEFLKDLVELDHRGYVKVTDNTKTNVEGLFAAGDVSDYRYRQAVTAAGLGCMAALDAEKFLFHK